MSAAAVIYVVWIKDGRVTYSCCHDVVTQITMSVDSTRKVTVPKMSANVTVREGPAKTVQDRPAEVTVPKRSAKVVVPKRSDKVKVPERPAKVRVL